MEKTILIPTDFRVASLNTLKFALEQDSQDPLRVILLYSEFLGDSITDLLFYSNDKIIRSHSTPEFMEALEVLRNRFAMNLQSIEIRLLHYNQIYYLNKFLSANNIDEIFIPKFYELKTTGNAFDPVPLLKQSNCKVIEVNWTIDSRQSEQGHLAILFS